MVRPIVYVLVSLFESLDNNNNINNNSQVHCKKKYMHKLATKTWKCTRCNVREEMRRVTGFSVSNGGSNQLNTPINSTATTPQISLKHAKSLRSVLMGGGKISKSDHAKNLSIVIYLRSIKTMTRMRKRRNSCHHLPSINRPV